MNPPYLFTSKDGKRLMLLVNDVQAISEEDWGTTIITADDAYRVTDDFADVAARLGCSALDPATPLLDDETVER